VVADGKTADRTLRAAGQNKRRRRGVQGSFTPPTATAYTTFQVRAVRD